MNLKRNGYSAGIFLAAAVTLFPGTASAGSVPLGTANIDGSVTVTNTSVSFFDTTGTIAGIFNTGLGTGSFAGLSAPDSIKNLTGGPVTGPIFVVDFATFSTTGGLIHFDLTNIDPGSGTAAQCLSNAIGNSCTPTGSPFTLTQVSANTVGFTFSLEGLAYRGTSASGTSSGQALFTGQQVPGTITGVLSTLSTTGSFSNSYSASVSVTPTPEPGSLLMFLTGGGILAASLVLRRRKARPSATLHSAS